jgi:hypothetical protein
MNSSLTVKRHPRTDGESYILMENNVRYGIAHAARKDDQLIGFYVTYDANGADTFIRPNAGTEIGLPS